MNLLHYVSQKIKNDLGEEVVLKEALPEECCQYLSPSDHFIIGICLPNVQGGRHNGGALVIFAKNNEQHFCKIANGVVRELTPQTTDSICEYLRAQT